MLQSDRDPGEDSTTHVEMNFKGGSCLQVSRNGCPLGTQGKTGVVRGCWEILFGITRNHIEEFPCPRTVLGAEVHRCCRTKKPHLSLRPHSDVATLLLC